MLESWPICASFLFLALAQWAYLSAQCCFPWHCLHISPYCLRSSQAVHGTVGAFVGHLLLQSTDLTWAFQETYKTKSVCLAVCLLNRSITKATYLLLSSWEIVMERKKKKAERKMVGFICWFLLIFCGFPFYLEIYKITDIIKYHRYLVIEQNQQLKHRSTEHISQ